MKQLSLMLAVAVVLVASAQSVEAQESRRVVRQQAQVRPAYRSQGFFSRMMEFERRKNAWLRQRFMN